MLFLVFPKPFEFGKFINELGKGPARGSVEVARLPVHSTVVYGVKRGEVTFWCIVVNESDIMFNTDFLAAVDELGTLYPPLAQHEFLLVGTAGAFTSTVPTEDVYSKSDDPLDVGVYKRPNTACLPPAVGTAHHINRAFKVDRAMLVDGPDGTVRLVPRLDKIAENDAHTSEVKLLAAAGLIGKSRGVLCSNQLMESRNMLELLDQPGCVAKAAIESKDDEEPNAIRAIVDMETFDFFAVCQSRNVTCHGAIRLISDVCGDPLATRIRSLVSFKEAVKMALHFAKRGTLPLAIESLGSLDWTNVKEALTLTIYRNILLAKVRKSCRGSDGTDKARYFDEIVGTVTNIYSSEYDPQYGAAAGAVLRDNDGNDAVLPLRTLSFYNFLLRWTMEHRYLGDRLEYQNIDFNGGFDDRDSEYDERLVGDIYVKAASRAAVTPAAAVPAPAAEAAVPAAPAAAAEAVAESDAAGAGAGAGAVTSRKRKEPGASDDAEAGSDSKRKKH